jgi:hypothetical protein
MLTNYKSSTTELLSKREPINWSAITPEKKIAIQQVLQKFMSKYEKNIAKLAL